MVFSEYSLCARISNCVINDECDQKLLKIADMALYQAKDNGRNTWIGYRIAHDTPSCALLNTDKTLSELIEGGALLALAPGDFIKEI